MKWERYNYTKHKREKVYDALDKDDAEIGLVEKIGIDNGEWEEEGYTYFRNGDTITVRPLKARKTVPRCKSNLPNFTAGFRKML